MLNNIYSSRTETKESKWVEISTNIIHIANMRPSIECHSYLSPFRATFRISEGTNWMLLFFRVELRTAVQIECLRMRRELSSEWRSRCCFGLSTLIDITPAIERHIELGVKCMNHFAFDNSTKITYFRDQNGMLLSNLVYQPTPTQFLTNESAICDHKFVINQLLPPNNSHAREHTQQMMIYSLYFCEIRATSWPANNMLSDCGFSI